MSAANNPHSLKFYGDAASSSYAVSTWSGTHLGNVLKVGRMWVAVSRFELGRCPRRIDAAELLWVAHERAYRDTVAAASAPIVTCALTVGMLRQAVAGLADDSLVGVFVDGVGYVPATDATAQASDAVSGPCGTNPMTQPTVGILLIDVDPAEVRDNT